MPRLDSWTCVKKKKEIEEMKKKEEKTIRTSFLLSMQDVVAVELTNALQICKSNTARHAQVRLSGQDIHPGEIGSLADVTGCI